MTITIEEVAALIREAVELETKANDDRLQELGRQLGVMGGLGWHDARLELVSRRELDACAEAFSADNAKRRAEIAWILGVAEPGDEDVSWDDVIDAGSKLVGKVKDLELKLKLEQSSSGGFFRSFLLDKEKELLEILELDKDQGWPQIINAVRRAVGKKVPPGSGKTTKEIASLMRRARDEPKKKCLPKFPDIGCDGDCAFESAGVGVQCKESGCGRYIGPGEEFFAEIMSYHRSMMIEAGRLAGCRYLDMDSIHTECENDCYDVSEGSGNGCEGVCKRQFPGAVTQPKEMSKIVESCAAFKKRIRVAWSAYENGPWQLGYPNEGVPVWDGKSWGLSLNGSKPACQWRIQGIQYEPGLGKEASDTFYIIGLEVLDDR